MKILKYIGIALAVIVGIIVLWGVFKPGGTETIPLTDGDAKAINVIKAESKVKKVTTSANYVIVAVEHNGDNRDGYAEYICTLLRENNASLERVHVVDINDSTKLLGKSNCETP